MHLQRGFQNVICMPASRPWEKNAIKIKDFIFIVTLSVHIQKKISEELFQQNKIVFFFFSFFFTLQLGSSWNDPIKKS
jgi:hypothetical protein